MFNNISEFFIKIINEVCANFPWLGKKINKFIINATINSCRHRPHPWSTAHNFISWTSLTDKNWSARHLPAKELNPPKNDIVDQIFKRDINGFRFCPKSTCLFAAFAQYLTDGFIRTKMPGKNENDDPIRKQNTSNHEIDLSPLYGRNKAQTDALRANEKGLLKSQEINGEEYAPFLFEFDQNDQLKIKEEYSALDKPLIMDGFLQDKQKMQCIFAFGGDRANASPQIAMMNTLFLREHNRLAKEISKKYPEWDSDRVFEIARSTNIVIFIKIVIDEYINHISPGFKFSTDPTVAWNAPWNKPNWITTEFSLLYRWHMLIPDYLKWGTTNYPLAETLLNNSLLIDNGIKQAFLDMSSQQAGQIGAFNTSETILEFEKKAIRQGRLCKLASYSDYREYVSLPRPKRFRDISRNPKVISLLEEVYENVEDVEFYVGLFAEDPQPGTPLPKLLRTMVAVDAFSQALTNPLLSEHVWKEETFSEIGWKAINETNNIRDIVNRNINEKLSASDFIGMTRVLDAV